MDSKQAAQYVIEPLTAPEPSLDDGPAGTPFRSTINSRSLASNYPTPPSSASPSRTTFHPSNPFATTPPPYRRDSEGQKMEGASRRSRETKNGSEVNNYQIPRGHHRKTSSLTGKFPGDMSHRPLETMKAEYKAADRASHLKKRHIPNADLIDTLDLTGFSQYHHEGPYDATLLARNTSYLSSPVAAVRDTNDEAIKATPKEYIKDSLTKHVPLQGTAIVPPGERTLDGHQMVYEEGADLMREEDAPGGAYKRYDFIKYHPDDLKGKGEPSFTIDRALKEHVKKTSSHRRILSDGDSAYEMQTQPLGSRPSASRQRSQSQGGFSKATLASGSAASRYDELEGFSSVNRSNTTGRKFSEGIKNRFGSLRRKSKAVGE